MPASFQFVRRTTLRMRTSEIDGKTYGPYYKGENDSLMDVDQIICAYHGIDCDDKVDSRPYFILVEWAFAALLNIGGSYIETKHIEWILERALKNKTDTIRFGKFLRWALLQQWRFEAWR